MTESPHEKLFEETAQVLREKITPEVDDMLERMLGNKIIRKNKNSCCPVCGDPHGINRCPDDLPED